MKYLAELAFFHARRTEESIVKMEQRKVSTNFIYVLGG